MAEETRKNNSRRAVLSLFRRSGPHSHRGLLRECVNYSVGPLRNAAYGTPGPEPVPAPNGWFGGRAVDLPKTSGGVAGRTTRPPASAGGNHALVALVETGLHLDPAARGGRAAAFP